MIIPANARGRLVLPDLIPSTALLGAAGVPIQNNRFFRGVHILTKCTAVAGAGQYRIVLLNYVGTEIVTQYIEAYATAIGNRSIMLYPGITLSAGSVAGLSACLPEYFNISIENSSAVPGNEVTVSVHACLLE